MRTEWSKEKESDKATADSEKEARGAKRSTDVRSSISEDLLSVREG
jgi:hypothetical protein